MVNLFCSFLLQIVVIYTERPLFPTIKVLTKPRVGNITQTPFMPTESLSLLDANGRISVGKQ